MSMEIFRGAPTQGHTTLSRERSHLVLAPTHPHTHNIQLPLVRGGDPRSGSGGFAIGECAVFVLGVLYGNQDL